ncbi:MAG TPA: restriction endonuclease subunit R [Nitrospiraceae bacterium]|nr:restriction endonuclease subunit R [Nitrospiraceae bacterium]
MPLNEADTRAKLIDPAIHTSGWTEDHIKREVSAGSIEIIEGKAHRRAKGRIDYTLRIRVTAESQPVAVALIEAKAERLPPGHGLEQAKAYAICKRINVPFVFSSNGHQFVEYDFFTGVTSSPRPLTEFPSPDDLRIRYENGKGFSLDSPAARPLLIPYTGGEGARRYYQDAAIRAVLEKIARCEITGEPKRALLSLATGAGKTFIAVNLLKKIADAGNMRRALFVCDRDELRTQGLTAMQKLFGSDSAAAAGNDPVKNARVVVATYQTLDVDSDEADANFLIQHYPENYFSHIVIDECHRSAWGKWSQVLTRNPGAVQIGLTATPREFPTADTTEGVRDEQITADNVRHFGEPVYEYDMAQAIEDGYLAACEIYKGRVNLDDTGVNIKDIIARNPKDALTGQPVGADYIRHRYEKFLFEDKLLLPDRVLVMCQDLFKYLLETGGPEQKTIIFCARDRHADDVAATMNNLYSEWCSVNGRPRLEPYAFKCTAASGGGDYLPDLRGAMRHHFIATTVDLLTTGVDVPCVRNIVFFKYVRSPIAFYQMVGRGTRIDLPTGKLMFRVYDYTDATRLFGEEFITRLPKRSSGGGGDGGGEGEPERSIVVEGFDVRVTPAGRYIVTEVDGKAMPVTVEEYKNRMAERLIQEAPTIDIFRRDWITPTVRHPLIERLVTSGYSPNVLRIVETMEEYDLYDVLADAAYGMAPRTRKGRAEAFIYKHEEWLIEMPPKTADVIKAIASQFKRGGTDGLENQQIFKTPSVMRAGGLDALKALGKPADVLRETKERMFSA